MTPDVTPDVTPETIAANHDVIRGHIRRTPVLGARIDGVDLALKCEFMQVAGSFKARGAFTNLLRRELPPSGVVAASGGNHGVAVAHAAHALGVPAAIFVPTISSPEKVARIRSLGAELVVAGDRYADALARAEEHHERTGAVAIHAFDDPLTLLGQGTLAAELLEQVPDVDTVVVPVGGGGLIGGIAAYLAGRVRVIGAEPDLAPTLALALEAGEPVDAPTGSVAADALAPRRIGTHVFPIAQRYIERSVLVTDEQILAARDALWAQARILLEPAAAVGAAAVLSGAYRPGPGERVAVVLSGANVNPA